MKTSFLFFVLIIIRTSNASAQTPSIAKYAGEFLSVGIGSKYLGMGGASVAIANDISGSYWNPAATSYINYLEITSTVAQAYSNLLNYQQIGIGLPLNLDKSISISLIRLGIDNIADTRNAWDFNLNKPISNAENHITRFNAADYALFLGFSIRTLFNLRFGTSIKLIYRHIGNIGYAWGIGLDVGLIYELKYGFNLGLSLQNITTSLIAWSNGTQELISPTIKFGIGHKIQNVLWGTLTWAFDTDWYFENRNYNALIKLGSITVNARFGLEYQFYDAIFLRAGFEEIALSENYVHKNLALSGKWTVGVGINFAYVSIDYALASFIGDGLGKTHRISMNLSLETLEFKRRKHIHTDPVDIFTKFKKLFSQ